jgi:hypothetical protein
MTIAQKDIEVSQGETTALFFKQIDSYGNGIDLTGQKAIFAIKRYPTRNKLMLLVTDTAVINGGELGEFTTSGYAGSGNTVVNQDTNAASVTGGISIFVDKDSMSRIPSGRHFYELSLINGSFVDRVFEGRVDVRAQFVAISNSGVGVTSAPPTNEQNYYIGTEAPIGASVGEGDRWWNTEISAEFVYLPVGGPGNYAWVQISGEIS